MMAYQIAPERRLAYRLIVFFVALLAAWAFGAMVTAHPHGDPEMSAEDVLQRLLPAAPRSDVVVVALDGRSVRRYGPVLSWPRSVLAKGLQQAESGGAKTVVMDLPLNKRASPAGDAEFWHVLANHRNVVLGMAYDANRQPPYTANDVRALQYLQKLAYTSAITFGPKTQVFPYLDFKPPVSDFIGSAQGVGVFDRETDRDGVVRDARMFYLSQIAQPSPMPALPLSFPSPPLANGTPVALPNITLSAAQSVFGLEKLFVVIKAGHDVDLAGNLNPPVDTPVDNQGRMQIRFAGPAAHLPSYSFADVVTGKVKPSVFKGDVVLFGATAKNDPAADLRETPFGWMPRVDVTANAISTLMNRSYYTLLTTRPHHTWAAAVLVGLIAGGLLMFFSGWRGLIVTLILLIVYLVVCGVMFAQENVMMPILPGVLTILTTYLISLLLMLGPFRPINVPVSPTYVPPPSDVVH